MAPSSNSRESSLSTPPEHNPVEPTSAGLDSGSELSELTDEEMIARKLPRVRANYRFVGRRPPSLLARRGGRKKRSNLVPAPMWGWVDKASAAEEEEEEELSEPPAAMEEEEIPEEEEEEPNSVIVNDSKRENTNLEHPPVSGIARDVGSDDDGPVNGDDDDDDEDGQAVVPSDEEIQPAEDETDLDDESDKNEEDDDDDEAEDEELNIASPGILTTTTVAMADAETLLSLAPAAGPPAITADDAEPPSPSSTSASNSVVSSRAPSPLPVESESAVPDLVSATRPRRSDIKGKLSLSRIEPPAEDDEDTPASSKEKSVGMDIDAPQDAQDDIEGEDGEPAVEEDLEAELDLQPAIRGEALDVLAILELKFALLRERLYVDKMQALAWEETLVDYGTHPELLHLHRELSKRRDKRLELATQKRAFEITNVNKRRRLDENATWSWWKQARDDLQKEMIAESNRKRRKLEREKRAMERPQPVRRIPTSSLEIPIPLSVRALVDSYVAGNPPRHDSQTLVYPQLSSLSSADIANDLDFIHVQKQSNMFDQHRNTVPLPSTAQQPPSILNYDPTFPDPFQPTSIPAAARANQLPLVGYHHAQTAPAPPQGMVGPGQAGPPFVPYNPGHGRPPHISGNSMHGPPSFVDPEPAWSVSSGPVNQNVGFSPHIIHPRRSVSPPLPPGLKTSGQWTGMGGFHSSKPDPEEEERREREKRERGHYEMERQREYHLQTLQQQQHHRHGASVHHSHNSTPTPHPSHHHHGRPHHHHVLHHHTPAAPTGATLSPRTTREMEGGRHATEIINLSSNKNHWKDDYREKRPSSAAPIIEDRDRPLAMPFTMSASHRSPPHRPEVSSPGRASWSQDEMYRSPMNSPGRYNRIGSLSERPRTLPPPSPSAARSPTRYRERSPPPKTHRPLSPVSKGALLPPLSTPVSRVPSPLLARGPGDRDQPRELLSPRPPSKMTVTQILD